MAWSNIGGGGENVKPEVDIQTPLIEDIKESLVGKATGANATEDTILEGYSAYVGQELVVGKYKPFEVDGWYTYEGSEKTMRPPISMTDGCCAVLNDNLHCFNNIVHYIWNGGTWQQSTNIPTTFSMAQAVTLNNEIHILGGNDGSTSRKHYKWTGTEWVNVSTLPYNFYRGSAVVFNNEIHIFGGAGKDEAHYKWDGTSWTSVSTLPGGMLSDVATVFNNKIYIAVHKPNGSPLYEWNNEAWTQVATLSQSTVYASCGTCNGKIHIVGGSNASGGHKDTHQAWDGENIITLQAYPSRLARAASVVYRNELHVLGNYDKATDSEPHYAYKEETT